MADLKGRSAKRLKRSPGWRALRRRFLRGKVCAVCGGKKKLEAHHVVPFHVAPERELDETNLLALCDSGRYGLDCHLFVGHLGNYRSWNVTARRDAVKWGRKMKFRPSRSTAR